ncbi:S1C family serine protease [Streptomyces sp. WMMC1477]|uniref:S1C family serine protease n=1 Tax=Streptomyces sp. WMMC1477 TaxID=3015155 RepID=UPI0022B6B48A|nr:trypsin-like peptidase domain-containing protein [Streptomyces sp. WMMC1477]MCZ7432609.1 trypsin-like peptidase domain-containing protein [Streptomyces sp. WMMC1477]
MNPEHEGVGPSPDERRAADQAAPAGDREPPAAAPDAQERPAPEDPTAPLPAVPPADPGPGSTAPEPPGAAASGIAPADSGPGTAPTQAPDAASGSAPHPGPESAPGTAAAAPGTLGPAADSGVTAPAAPTKPPAAPTSPPAFPASPGHVATPAPTAQHGSGGWGPPPASPPPGSPTGHHGPQEPHGPGDGRPGHGGSGGGYGPGGPGPAQPWGAPLPPPAPRKRRGPLVAALVVAALLAGGVGGGVGYWAADRADSTSETVGSSSSDGQRTLNRAPDSVAGIAEEALPSVVTIQVNGGSENRGGGTGTGFVFDKQGHILTNNHVVASAARGADLNVVFSDGKQYDAQVVGRAEGYDIAVIKLSDPDGATLTPLPLGDSDKVAVGDSTIAIGAPFGLSGTVTTGIVSALNRPVASSDAQGSAPSYMSALQTDASINPGNSGGPLLNADGEVIGVNSAIQSSGGGPMEGPAGSIGLGFAIPIDQAKRVATTLIETGEPVYPIIGATVEMRQSGNGALISERGEGDAPAVTPGGPADRAGLRPGDVITKFDGTPIDSGPTLISEIWTHTPDETVTLTYERDGKETQVELTLGERVGDGD